MPWITPKTDWVAGNVPTADDFNRIEGNISYLEDSSGARSATLIVAASNSSAKGKAAADYVCDGVDDQVEINSALDALGSTGGRVLLLEGTYIVSASINVPSNATLAGQGPGTVIKIKDALDVDINVVQNADQTNGNTKIIIRDFSIDGNKANNTSGAQEGIYLYKTTYSLVTGLVVTNCRSHGIHLSSSSNNTITGNIYQGNDGHGIRLFYLADNNAVTGNICQGNSNSGICLDTSSNNTVVGNTCQGNTERGIYLSANYNTVTGNTCQGNHFEGIHLSSSSNNTITGNICRENYFGGIYLYLSSNNTITGNICLGNREQGILLSSSSNNTITGNTCLENSQSANNTYDNIQIYSDSDYNNVQANTCRQGTLTNKPRYGICIESTDCDKNMVTNNDLFQGGATGAFSDAGTSTATAAGNRTA